MTKWNRKLSLLENPPSCLQDMRDLHALWCFDIWGSFKSNTGRSQWCLSAEMMCLRDPCSQEIVCTPYAKGLLQLGTVGTKIYNPPILPQDPFNTAAAVPEREWGFLCYTSSQLQRSSELLAEQELLLVFGLDRAKNPLNPPKLSHMNQSAGRAFLVLRKIEMVHHTKAMAGLAHTGC